MSNQQLITYINNSVIKVTLNFLLVFCLSSFSVNHVHATNKESFSLDKENFSTEDDIALDKLYRHIHYRFENEVLLREALYPLLPKTLQKDKKKFEHLEFIGDGVLDLVMRERILNLFPDHERSVHDALVKSLVKNVTLTDIYINSLKIESYLPYPGPRPCKYCNVVESLIGAIYLDNPKRGLRNSKMFIMRMLDDHILRQKWQEVLDEKKKIAHTKGKSEMSLGEASLVLPPLKKIIAELFDLQKSEVLNPKTSLGIILAKMWNDQPVYTFSISINEYKKPGFLVNVTAAQIGDSITCFGYTLDEGEQNVARRAINFLAHEELLPLMTLNTYQQTYTKFINEYCQVKTLSLTCKKTVLAQPRHLFTSQVQIGQDLIEDTGDTLKKANENTARKVCQHLVDKGIIATSLIDSSKESRSLLKEWHNQGLISDLQPVKKEERYIPAEYKFKVVIDTNVIGEGTGSPENQARENAYCVVFEQLLERQQKDAEDKESSKPVSKKTNTSIEASQKKASPPSLPLPNAKYKQKKKSQSNSKNQRQRNQNTKVPDSQSRVVKTNPISKSIPPLE